jgi:uncharacterized membrane protein
MQARTRRIVQAVLYESIAVGVVGPGLAFLFDQPQASTIALAAFMSAFALGWSYIFNAWFEKWESRQAIKGRSWKRRIVHGLSFEGGLVVMLVPVMAHWLNTSILPAFIANLGVLGFFFVYAIVFTWGFDKVFGLPQSAINACEA